MRRALRVLLLLLLCCAVQTAKPQPQQRPKQQAVKPGGQAAAAAGPAEAVAPTPAGAPAAAADDAGAGAGRAAGAATAAAAAAAAADAGAGAGRAAGVAAAAAAAPVAAAPSNAAANATSAVLHPPAAADDPMAALAAYVVWHRQQRLKAAPDVRVLRLVAQAQFGIGDQCRSVMLALRVAITWNLYLEASFNPNLNFTRFMRPPAGGVDWTPRFNVNKQNSEKKVEADDLQPLAWKLLPLLRQRNSTKHIILSTDLSESAEHKLMFGPRRGPHDLVGVLFELTPLVAQLADASLGAMFGGAAPAAYVAVHLRLGGLLGEGGVGFRQAGLPAHCEHLSVFAAQTCARRLDKGLKQGPAGAFVLLSDNDIVRAVVRDGLLAGVVGPTSRAMHVSTAVSLQPWQAKNAITDAFVEIAHMARATCFVYANSGFSRLAAWLSNSTCMVSLNDCIGAFAKTVPGGKLKC